ncbi:MAG: tryptophan synthase subunit alpha [Bernardetiaceae bacterium]
MNMNQNRIDALFARKKSNILTIYFTAGFPKLNDTLPVLEELVAAGVDLIEIGMPFSDPLADGPTIQQSSLQAIQNGMNIPVLFEQLRPLRERIPDTPILLMGYLNPVMQFGWERFCRACQEVGIDGLILPDLPHLEYTQTYRPLMVKHGLHNIFLVTPQTSDERIRIADQAGEGFLYAVSSAAITGNQQGISDAQVAYFERLQKLHLKNPHLIGFGISNAEDFARVCQWAAGGIIGSAFIRHLAQNSEDVRQQTRDFVHKIR